MNHMKHLILSFATLYSLALTHNMQAQTIQDLELTFSKMPVRDARVETFLKDHEMYNAQGSVDGIYYTVEVEGSGRKALPGDYVTVHYTGTLLDGSKFDSSKDRNAPFSFQIGTNRVIQGWEKGIPLFPVGGKGKLYLPSSLAYGDRAVGGRIPANSPLIFEIEVLDVLPAEVYMEKMREEQIKQQMMADSLAKIQVEKDKAVIAEYAASKGLKMETTSSGLSYIMEKPGAGDKVKVGQRATVHYAGFLLDGTKFDASYDRNEPFTLQVGVGQVIAGWDEGLQLLNKGAKARFFLPSTLAYGSRGAGGVIPPNAVLIFDVEVLDIQ
jgi:FKBP-type peptidyl-prolyl cis-trans isomerase